MIFRYGQPGNAQAISAYICVWRFEDLGNWECDSHCQSIEGQELRNYEYQSQSPKTRGLGTQSTRMDLLGHVNCECTSVLHKNRSFMLRDTGKGSTAYLVFSFRLCFLKASHPRHSYSAIQQPLTQSTWHVKKKLPNTKTLSKVTKVVFKTPGGNIEGECI